MMNLENFNKKMIKKKNKETFFFGEVKEIFNKLDSNHDGRISKFEFYENIKKLNLNFSSQVIDKIFEDADFNKNNEISYEELKNYINSKDIYLKKLFNFIDTNKSGFLDKEELKNSFSYFNYKISNKELDQLIKKFSIKNKNVITYSDFIKFHHQYPIENIRNFFNEFIRESIDIGQSVQIRKNDKLSPLIIICSYSFGGIISRTLTAPFDRIKIQMQAKTDLKTIKETFSYIKNDGGYKSFFQGNGTNIIKLLPDTLIRYFIYNYFIERVKGEVGFLEKIKFSAIASMVSCLIVYPLEICRTRLSLTGKDLYRGTFHCILDMIEKEG